jgi:ribonuclease J
MNSLKILSLGGFGQVTSNMFVYETERDILIVDCGIGFPTEEMYGVDLLIPDISYLLPKKKKIRGIIISHAHDDHIGALPYILPNLPETPVFASRWAKALAEEKLKEFGVPASLVEIHENEAVRLGNFKVEFIGVTHSIPETMHLVIETPIGYIYHAADFKLDLTPVMGKPTDQKRISEVGRRGILCLLSDSLRAERPGFTPSEKTLEEVFEREMGSCRGKFFVTTMSSNISRLKQAIDVSLKHGRKIILVGRSIEKNVEIALRLGYLKYPRNIFLPLKSMKNLLPSSLSLLVAGSQAQAGSALERIVAGEREVKIEPLDKIVFSTDYIPGNEVAINELIDNILRLGAEVSYVGINSDVHVSGHGSASDLKKLIELVRPKYLLPIGGNFRHAVAYQKLALQLGYKKEDIILADDGQVVELSPFGQVDLNKKFAAGTVMVDALGIGDVGNVVLRDRKVLSEEGIVVAIVILNKSTLKIIGEPEIVSRGFVYVRSSEELIHQAQREIKIALNELRNRRISTRFLRIEVQGNLEKFFFKKTGRRPMVLLQLIEV